MSIPSADMFDDWKDWAKAVKQELDKPTNFAVKEQVGKIAVFKGTAVGPGYLLCNGASFSKEAYPSLYQFLGSNILPNLTASYGIGYVVGIKV